MREALFVVVVEDLEAVRGMICGGTKYVYLESDDVTMRLRLISPGL